MSSYNVSVEDHCGKRIDWRHVSDAPDAEFAAKQAIQNIHGPECLLIIVEDDARRVYTLKATWEDEDCHWRIRETWFHKRDARGCLRFHRIQTNRECAAIRVLWRYPAYRWAVAFANAWKGIDWRSKGRQLGEAGIEALVFAVALPVMVAVLLAATAAWPFQRCVMRLLKCLVARTAARKCP